MFQLPSRRQPIPVLLIWAVLALEFVASLWNERWALAFVAAVTFLLTLIPMVLIRRAGIRLPASFTVAIVVFVFATIFLGEAFDFYNRYWWWDIALHGGSALGFGLTGFLFAFLMFEDEKYHAPPWALGLIGFTFAMTIGALWELFEWQMDAHFGTTMQKSGLSDTMGDLVVNMIGGAAGGFSGFLHLKGIGLRGVSGALAKFLAENRRLMQRRRRR